MRLGRCGSRIRRRDDQWKQPRLDLFTQADDSGVVGGAVAHVDRHDDDPEPSVACPAAERGKRAAVAMAGAMRSCRAAVSITASTPQ